MEFDPRDYAAEFDHARANLATRTAEAHSAQVTVPIVDASVFGRLHSAELCSEPLGRIEEAVPGRRPRKEFTRTRCASLLRLSGYGLPWRMALTTPI